MKATNLNTSESFAASTAANALYTIPLIKPAEYELITEAPGFKQFCQTALLSLRG